MDWTGLTAFVAVAETGGFSAAAEQLHLTQPAVSKRIAQLEQSLQVRLFDRLGRQVVLTEAGRARGRSWPSPRRRAVPWRSWTRASAAACAWPPATTSACTGCRRCCAASPPRIRRWHWTSASWIPSRLTPRCCRARWNWP